MSNEPDRTSNDPDRFRSGQVSEQARLEATALVASRVSREESHMILRRAQVKAFIREAIIVLLVVAVAILAARNATEGTRTKHAVINGEQQSCKLYADIASAPLSKGTTVTGLTLIADFRNNYYTYRCQDKHGLLGQPDQRLLPYLDQEALAYKK